MQKMERHKFNPRVGRIPWRRKGQPSPVSLSTGREAWLSTVCGATKSQTQLTFWALTQCDLISTNYICQDAILRKGPMLKFCVDVTFCATLFNPVQGWWSLKTLVTFLLCPVSALNYNLAGCSQYIIANCLQVYVLPNSEVLRAEPKILLCFCILLFASFFFFWPCGMQDFSSLTRNWTSAPCNGSSEPQPLDQEEILLFGVFYTFQYPGCSTGPCLWLAFSKHVWNVIGLQSFFARLTLRISALEDVRIQENVWRLLEANKPGQSWKTTYHAASLPSGLEMSSWFLVCYSHIVGHTSPILTSVSHSKWGIWTTVPRSFHL